MREPAGYGLRTTTGRLVIVSILSTIFTRGEPLFTRALRLLGLTILLAHVAIAQTPGNGNRTYIAEDIYVADGQQVHNAVCIFCSVQVEGDLSGRVFVLFGNLNVSGRIHGGATVIGGNAIIDSQARIGGNAVVLGGNAVYETDESISGSSFVLGGHISKTGGHTSVHRRVSVGPAVFFLLAILAFLLLSIFVSPHVRRRIAVSQAT